MIGVNPTGAEPLGQGTPLVDVSMVASLVWAVRAFASKTADVRWSLRGSALRSWRVMWALQGGQVIVIQPRRRITVAGRSKILRVRR